MHVFYFAWAAKPSRSYRMMVEDGAGTELKLRFIEAGEAIALGSGSSTAQGDFRISSAIPLIYVPFQHMRTRYKIDTTKSSTPVSTG